MKLTDPDVIKSGEKDLIDSVKDDLDLDAVKQILEKKLAATALSSKGGEIVVHNNEIAFRLDFDLNLTGSLMFDRQGNYIPESEESNITDKQEESIPADLDLEDIDITETLEEMGSDTLLDDKENREDDDIADKELDINEPFEEELEINLPDYDLDDELTPEENPLDGTEGEETTAKGIEDSEIDDLEDLKNGPVMEPDIDDQETIEDNLVDDDINHILKESQEFWEPGEDS